MRTVLSTFTGPISPLARRTAEQWYRQQATPKKGEQVRLNTLAVSFVDSYLQYMGFSTDLEKSDSWNPVQQTLMDVADLSLGDLGKLECRPLFGEPQVVCVPPEVQSDRIGYVVVQISQSFREATLLGFVTQVRTDLLLISQLQPLENLLEYLEELAQAKLAESTSQSLATNKTLVKLKQWLENTFEDGWQEVETLLGTRPAHPALSLRSAKGAFVCRSKLVGLGEQSTTRSAVLVVAWTSENEQEVDIIVEVHPPKGQTYLPPNLQLMVLDFDGVAVMAAQARSSNENIQLQFSCEPGERFSVKVTLEDVSAIEDFII